MKTLQKTVASIVALLITINLTNGQTMKTYPLTAKGSFSVTMKPEGQNKVGDITFGRYAIDKVFKGDLEGTSKVDMLGASSDNGSGAYVAIESVSGTLNGKTGIFLLIHNGTMTKTSQQLTVTVVPGCSTGDLTTLEGKLTINIVGKEHFYVLEYSL
jgi:Protein of unknown function (DUF3224)